MSIFNKEFFKNLFFCILMLSTAVYSADTFYKIEKKCHQDSTLKEKPCQKCQETEKYITQCIDESWDDLSKLSTEEDADSNYLYWVILGSYYAYTAMYHFNNEDYELLEMSLSASR